MDSLQKEVAAIDNDVKAKFSQYNQTKTNLASLQRSQTGNLSQKSLNAVVNPDTLLKPDQSEYLQQHLVAVPTSFVKDFLKTYESISPMVVPRSAQILAKDDEFQLYVVTTFKKHAAEFVHACREHRWTPREMKFTDGGRDAEEAELRKLEKEERKTWGEALRLGRTGYSDAVMAWIHVLTLRVFVETVLRYGLPLAYVCGLIKVRPTSCPLQTSYSILTLDRPRQSWQRKPSLRSTIASQISVATRSVAIRKADQNKTIAPCNRNWQAQAWVAIKASSLMSSTNSRSYSDVSGDGQSYLNTRKSKSFTALCSVTPNSKFS